MEGVWSLMTHSPWHLGPRGVGGNGQRTVGGLAGIANHRLYRAQDGLRILLSSPCRQPLPVDQSIHEVTSILGPFRCLRILISVWHIISLNKYLLGGGI